MEVEVNLKKIIHKNVQHSERVPPALLGSTQKQHPKAPKNILPNQTYQTKLTIPNLPNQTYQTKTPKNTQKHPETKRLPKGPKMADTVWKGV